jgi:hypothetical protein
VATKAPDRRRRTAALALAALLAGACTPRRRSQPEPMMPPPLRMHDSAVSAPPATDELVPGTERVFGLLIPTAARPRAGDAAQRIFDVYASPGAVIRYLQSRLEIVTTDYLGPTGAMIRAAHVRASPAGESWTVDAGVRAEGDHALLLLTNRTVGPATPRSLEDGLRASGIDPRTHQPLPANNR